MYLKEVLNKCKEMGHPMTAMGLYKAGEKNGFISKTDGKSYDFDKDKFLEWLNNAIKEVPNNYISLKNASEKFGISIAQVYLLIKNPKVKTDTFGAGKGVIYVDAESLETVINERKNNKYEWD